MTTATETQDRKVANAVDHSGFRPQLYTVVTGSYASNSVYGSGAALVNDFTDEQLQDLSEAVIRQQDRDTTFSLKVVLDLSQVDPGFDYDEEIRIRTLQPLVSSDSPRYLTSLSVNAREFRLPLFLDVEIVDPSTGAPFAGFPSEAGIGQLQARLLHGGALALVVTDLTAGPPPTVTPLTFVDLVPLFGAGAGTQLRISVRGTYRGQNQPR